MNENTFRKAEVNDSQQSKTQPMFNESGESQGDSSQEIPPHIAERAQRFGELMVTFHSSARGKAHVQRMEAFGTQIRRVRMELNLERSDLARLTGLTAEFLFNLEHGMLSIEEIKQASHALAQALQIPSEAFQSEIERLTQKESGHEHKE